MEAKTFGYARVSSDGQKLDRQVDALLRHGLEMRDIIVDKESGKSLERQGYLALKNSILRRGDTLVVKELDRLSRNKADIKGELEYYRQAGIRVKILDIPTTLADFPEGQEWVMEMVNNILIEVLGSIAQEERLKIRRRQREGIEMAQKRGVNFGRPGVKKPEGYEEVMKKVLAGEMKAVDAMQVLGVKKTSFYKLRKTLLAESQG